MLVPRFLRAAGAIVVTLAVMGGTATAKDWTRVRLGTSADDPPNTSVRPDGTLEGFEIDFAADICKRMRVECEWVRQDFDGLIPALLQEKFDVIFVVLAITPKRRETIEFSTPISGNRQGVLVPKSSPLAAVGTGDIDVVSLDDSASAQPAIDALAGALQGKVVGTDSGGARIEMAKRYFRGSELRTYPTPGDVRRELLAGHIVAALATIDSLEGPDSSELQRIGPWFSGGIFGPGAGVGLRKTDPELKAKLDEAIKAALADGTIKNLALQNKHHWVPPM
jgi:octopine/nopaline transport system substrate-binding protein